MNQWEQEEAHLAAKLDEEAKKFAARFAPANPVPAPVGTIVATSAATAVQAEQPAAVVPPSPSLKEKLMAELHKLEEEVLGVKQ